MGFLSPSSCFNIRLPLQLGVHTLQGTKNWGADLHVNQVAAFYRLQTTAQEDELVAVGGADLISAGASSLQQPGPTALCQRKGPELQQLICTDIRRENSDWLALGVFLYCLQRHRFTFNSCVYTHSPSVIFFDVANCAHHQFAISHKRPSVASQVATL